VDDQELAVVGEMDVELDRVDAQGSDVAEALE
jgi:hypothetical protein